MQTLIALRDQDYLLSFVEELSERSENFPLEESVKYLETSDYSHFVISILQHLLESESQSSGHYVITFSALARIKDPSEFSSTIKAIIDIALNQDNKNGFSVIVRVLISALNSLPVNSSRVPLFFAILKLAQRENKLTTMPAFITQADKLAKEWKLSPAQEIQMLREVVCINEKVNCSSEAAYRHRMQVLRLCEEQGPTAHKVLDSAQFVRESVLQALALPQVIEFQNLTSNKFVMSILEKEDGQVLELLKLFEKGDYKSLAKWIDSQGNKEILTKYGRKEEDVRRKMRFLSLCELAESKKTVKFSEIAAALDVSVDSVQEWVMEAVTSNLIKAKIDQLEEVVTFLSFSVRSMDPQKWNDLALALDKLQSRFQVKFDSYEKNGEVSS